MPRLQSRLYPRLALERQYARPREGSWVMHQSEHDLVRLLVAPVGELAPFAHDEKPHFVNTRIDAALSPRRERKEDGLPPAARTLVEHAWQGRGPNLHGLSNR